MKRSSLFMALLLAAVSASAALEVGDAAPVFSAEASQAGQAFTYSLKDNLAQGPVVVYFYPSAYTSGCNIQAHAFSVEHHRFVAAGASIVGVSLDSVERLNTFSADPLYCAGNFAVASDSEGRIARSFDLQVGGAVKGARDTRGVEIDHGFAERTTFVLRRDGTVAGTIGGVNPEENVRRALEVVQHLGAAR